MNYLRAESVVRYDCPHCRAELESYVGRWRGWLLCPSCGKPGLPPPPRLLIPAEPTPVTGAGLRAEAWIASGDLPDSGWPRWSRESEPLPPRPTGAVVTARAAMGVGLALSLFLLLVAFLDQNSSFAAAAGLTALLLYWLRLRLGRLR